jgi:hypothetical protein
MPPFTIEDAEREYENPEYIKMIITNDLYQQFIYDLFGDELSQGDSGFWTDGAMSRVYLDCKFNLLDHYNEVHFSKDFKKQVIHTFGIFQALQRYYNKCGSAVLDIFESDDGEDEFYNWMFNHFILEHIRDYEEEWREEDRVEEDEEEEEEVDTDEASDADTDEEN